MKQDGKLSDIFEAADLDITDIRSVNNQRIAQGWMAEGIPVALIVKTIREVRAGHGAREIPTSLSYYSRPVRRAFEESQGNGRSDKNPGAAGRKTGSVWLAAGRAEDRRYRGDDDGRAEDNSPGPRSLPRPARRDG